MIPRSKHIIITVILAIALLAGLLFARSATGHTDNLASIGIQGMQFITPTSTLSAAPTSGGAGETREGMRNKLLEELRTAP